jgi:hypothetical protein
MRDFFSFNFDFDSPFQFLYLCFRKQRRKSASRLISVKATIFATAELVNSAEENLPLFLIQSQG